MCPRYPRRDCKWRLNGAVCRNYRIKRVVPCRCYSTSNLNFDNSILFYLANFLFYSILYFLFCILFYLAVQFSVMFYSVFYSIMHSILFYSILLSILFCFVFYSVNSIMQNPKFCEYIFLHRYFKPFNDFYVQYELTKSSYYIKCFQNAR